MKYLFLASALTLFFVITSKAQNLIKEKPKFKSFGNSFEVPDLKVNPFENQDLYTQLRSLKEKNGFQMPIERELNIYSSNKTFIDNMPKKELEGSSNMPIKKLENDKDYTILIKPLY